MLKQRVITALVLMAILIPALLTSLAWPFAVFTLVFIAAAGWEWGRLNGAGASGSMVLAAVIGLACAAALAAGWTRAAPPLVWWLGALLWVAGGAWALKVGPAGWQTLPRALRWALGSVVLFTVWLAMASARSVGVNFILSVFCLVWAADIAAYFGGRAFGRRKLAPSISPGKSWEGVWSGLGGVLLLALGWMWLDRSRVMDSSSLYTKLYAALGPFAMLLSLLCLTAMSVVGDLVESLVKRSAGAKDSSGLLPGHGGVLDRVDALLPVFPIALALSSL